jgi:hypothetical protein
MKNVFFLFAALLLPITAYAYVRQQEENALPDTPVPDSPEDYPFTLDQPSFVEQINIFMTKAGTRGERNNNPGNIRLSASNWQGKTSGSDTAFETFESPEKGIRALAILLKNYARGGCNTIRKIITRYAPASENNTAAYVQAVSMSVGIGPDAVLDFNDLDTLNGMVAAIIRHENGRVIYSASQITDGVSQA